mgnify:FL=1
MCLTLLCNRVLCQSRTRDGAGEVRRYDSGLAMPVLGIANLLSWRHFSGPNIRRITAIVDLFDQKPRIGINKGEGLKTLADGSIEFRNVSFVR